MPPPHQCLQRACDFLSSVPLKERPGVGEELANPCHVPGSCGSKHPDSRRPSSPRPENRCTTGNRMASTFMVSSLSIVAGDLEASKDGSLPGVSHENRPAERHIPNTSQDKVVWLIRSRNCPFHTVCRVGTIGCIGDGSGRNWVARAEGASIV